MLVLRRLDDTNQSIDLVLGLDVKSLGLGLGVEEKSYLRQWHDVLKIRKYRYLRLQLWKG